MKRSARVAWLAVTGLSLLLIALGQHVHAQTTHLPDLAFWKNATLEDAVTAVLRGVDIHARDNDGNTHLHMAAGQNHNPDVAKLLLDRGADIHARTKSGHTPLHMAAGQNHNPDVAKLLLDRGADLEARDNDLGNTPLHAAACCNNNPEVARLLLEYGASLDAVNHDDRTPVDLANENPKARVIAVFLMRYMEYLKQNER